MNLLARLVSRMLGRPVEQDERSRQANAISALAEEQDSLAEEQRRLSRIASQALARADRIAPPAERISSYQRVRVRR